MNKELRRVSVLVLAMFVALFGSSTIIQVFQQDNLRADNRNVRVLYDSYSVERGQILVAGQAIAQSVPSNDNYKFQRQYTQPDLYSSVTGYFPLNGQPTGVEGALNSYLSGTANQQFLAQVNAIVTGQPAKGANVALTLDPKVQQAAYDALGTNSGSVVAIEPSTGRILAMVSKPSFDPNQLTSHNGTTVQDNYNALVAASGSPLKNRAIAGDLYPPGSTFKLVVASAALQAGLTQDSTFDNPAQLTLPQSTSVINNAEGGACGGGATVTMAIALQNSCNIPFAELGAQLGYNAISAQAKAFGFGDTGLKVPMAVTASQYPQTSSQAELMLSSFGQASDRVTPMQMAMISATIANGGTEMRPTLIDSITNADLTKVDAPEFAAGQVYGNPITPATASTLRSLMVNVVNSGTGTNARISGVDVAGKTGTAENAVGQPYTLWFTGFAPAQNPKVAVAVVVENGGGKGQGAVGNTFAAPIAKKVMEAVLNK